MVLTAVAFEANDRKARTASAGASSHGAARPLLDVFHFARLGSIFLWLRFVCDASDPEDLVGTKGG